MTLAEQYMDMAEFARAAGIHLESMRRLVKQGRAPMFKAHNVWLIERDKAQQWIANYDRRPVADKWRGSLL